MEKADKMIENIERWELARFEEDLERQKEKTQDQEVVEKTESLLEFISTLGKCL